MHDIIRQVCKDAQQSVSSTLQRLRRAICFDLRGASLAGIPVDESLHTHMFDPLKLMHFNVSSAVSAVHV